MGERTMVKYITLATIGLRIASRMFAKIKEARASGSEGGEDITLMEWLDLGNEIALEITNSIPELDAYVLIMPKDMGYE